MVSVSMTWGMAYLPMNAEHRMAFVCVSRPILVLSLLFLFGCTAVRAQAVAEAAAATAVSGSVSTQASTVVWPQKAISGTQNAFAHLAAPSGPPSEVTNRQALEKRAGKDACKLLLRSQPTGAQVWVDGAFVGNTPLLLLVAPGKYQVQMRGQRLESARQVVGLLPHESQDVELKLAIRYPLRVTAH